MRILAASALLASTLLAPVMLSASAQARAVSQRLSPQAVDRFIAEIRPLAASAAEIERRCDEFMAEIARRQAELEGEQGRATISTTLRRYDDIQNLLTATEGEFTLYQQVMADQPRRDAGSACLVRFAGARSKLNLSRPVYDRLKAIDASKADAPTRLYLQRQIATFERAGVALDPGPRAEVQALQEQIAQVGAEFDTAIANGRKTIQADPAELAGLPADYIAAHAPGPDGKVTISTDYPDYGPVMAYAESSALRRRLMEAYLTRAHPENDPRLRRLFDLRQQLATKLGRANYAALILEDKMLASPARVEQLLAEMAAAARPAAERDYATKLAVLRQKNPAATRIDLWDSGWLNRQVQQQKFAYDRQEARQYFAYNKVRDGILKLTADLFSVEIRKWDTPVWHPSVETYEMVDGGRVIGRFYFDNHPRPGKYSHANMIPLRNGIAGRSIPVAALVQNFPAGDHATGLMEHGDVTTFLHEFGHLIHGLFSGTQRWALVSGINTEWDFVEAPSQMLENWVYDYDTLKTLAVNARGEPIPRGLVEKMNRARYFDIGMQDMRQLGLSNASLRFHQGPAPAGDLGTAFRGHMKAYDLLDYPPGTQMQASFNHLNGYSAIYYTYRWSKVIADDLFTRFAAEGLRNRETASRYRKLVLEPGGAKPAAELVQDFLGRPISLDAYKAEMAKNR